MKKIIFSILTLCVLTGVAYTKESITVLNAGSKTGSFAIQMTTLSKDLADDYNVDLKIPGDYCTALQMMDDIKEPFIMPYANDYESIGRDGEGCGTLAFEPSNVIRYDSTSFVICSMDGDNKWFLESPATVGHTLPATVFARSINAMNDSFGAQLTPVMYDGSGATKTGLYNGEVDYVLLSIKHGRDIMSNGGQCHYEFSNDENTDLVALGLLDKNNKQFVAGYHSVWLGYNMSDEQLSDIKSKIQAIHNDPNSGMFDYTKGGTVLKYYFDLNDKEIVDLWENSVTNLRK
jgi:hypothetical protein